MRRKSYTNLRLISSFSRFIGFLYIFFATVAFVAVLLKPELLLRFHIISNIKNLGTKFYLLAVAIYLFVFGYVYVIHYGIAEIAEILLDIKDTLSVPGRKNQ